MANILWKAFENSQKDDYLTKIKILGMLSGLFKSLEGKNGKKPYLHYRNHEIIFMESFPVTGITRKDSAFDAIAHINDRNIGIGLKTWLHSADISNQKIAEFNKNSRDISDFLKKNDVLGMAKKIATLRNERIDDDKRLYETNMDIYHFVTRGDNIAYVVECPYIPINVENISIITQTDRSISFFDGQNTYLYNLSKSTLFKKFDATPNQRVASVPISIADNAFEILESVWKEIQTSSALSKNQTSIVLPLYNDRNYKVNGKSGFNSSLGKSKTKDSDKSRPAYEAYASIPKFIHALRPNFFGFNALDPFELKSSDYFNLHMPSGKVIKAIITQDNGKSLQSNPQSVLGKWLLYNIFGLREYQPLSRTLLESKQIDSLIVTKIDEKNFKVDVGNYLDYEKWKILHKEDILKLCESGQISKRAVPEFRDDLVLDTKDDEDDF